MEHALNRDTFFYILQELNKNCKVQDYKDKYIDNVEKITSLLNLLDLNAYQVDYIQNRFIMIKQKNIPLCYIKQIIFCPFDTRHNVNILPSIETIYNYKPKKRNSYLTKPINKTDRVDNVEDNEKDCIMGNLEPSILNASIAYMLINHLLSSNTMVVFTLKNYDSKWSSLDVLEYLQNNISGNETLFHSIVDLDFTSNTKGLPSKDYAGKIELAINSITDSFNTINNITNIDDLKDELNYTLTVNHNLKMLYNKDFSYHNELVNYYKFHILMKLRLFIFTNQEPNSKFNNIFLYKPFLTEWDSVEKYINIIIAVNKL